MRVGLSLVLLSIGFSAQAFIFIDPVNLIQNTISASNSVSSLYNQIQNIKMQLKNFQQNWARLGSFHYRDIGNSLMQMDNITRQGQSLSYSMQNIDANFKRLYPDYGQSKNFSTSYQQWNQSTMSTLNHSLQSIGMNVQSVQQEEGLMKQLQAQSQSAQGRLQVMQTANEISTENIRQLESLKHLIAAQNNAQTAFMAREVSHSSYQQKSLQELVAHTQNQFPAYRNNPNFGLIESK